MKNEKIVAKEFAISIQLDENSDFFSLTDIARHKNAEAPDIVVQNWLRRYDTIEFLGLWETLNNVNFKPIEFEGFKNAAGANSFTLSPQKWIKATNALGLRSKSGRYGGGTFAHIDIAMEFASWVSPEFKLYIIKEYQRLKSTEVKQQSLEWNLSRTLSKINYRIHTDAIKEFLIPPELTPEQASLKYAEEADVLNMALFGKTAKQWREENPQDAKTGNMRDFAPLEHLIVLSNLENINSMLIGDKVPQNERLLKLNKTAITQLKSLYADKRIGKLKSQSLQRQIGSATV
ncbi:hypothetical protein FACS1894125_1120 [Actinomycetota bacterium]|nr:hypothetical protein FACS1894125_1120 [Actinomycetota bacterium]